MLQKIIENELGNVEENNLAVSLIIACILVLCMMFLYIDAITKMAETERNLLDVRNEIVERQYREMKEAYERYRLLYTMKSICYYI